MKALRLWYTDEAPFGNENVFRLEKSAYSFGNGETDMTSHGADDGWEKWSLPLGNGYMGVNVFGRKKREKLQITENSLCNPYAKGEGGLQSCALLYLDFPHTEFGNYTRYLELTCAKAGVEYDCEGVHFKRTYFTSYPDNVFVMHLEADKPNALRFTVSAEIPFVADGLFEPQDGMGKTGEVTQDGQRLILQGSMQYYGIVYEGQLTVSHTDGSVTIHDNCFEIADATEATLLFTVGTNYEFSSRVFTEKNTAHKLFGFSHPHEKVSRQLECAMQKSYETLWERHIKEYQELFCRVEFSVSGENADLPTDILLKEYQEGISHPYLEELYFQYGRYLLISASRPGTYPANLQGTWSQYGSSPWSSGYWHNINVQMNYWPAFNTNLLELFEPYVEYWKAYLPLAQEHADHYIRTAFPERDAGDGKNGWTIGTGAWLYDISGAELPPNFGHSGPSTGALTSKLFWEYYAFSQDKDILKHVTYPAVEGMSAFLGKVMEKQDDVYLVKYSASPEQKHEGSHYHTIGCAFDQQLVWENHKDLSEAAEILGIENEIVEQAREQLPHLEPVIIGKNGQIKEYREEEYYGDIGEHQHRHISHLIGLYPGTSISGNDSYLQAAKYTLNRRGDQSTGWATAHRLNAWARTKDGNRAYDLYQILLKECTLSNLWDSHPPFQIDGNLGGTAGVAEMLLQSHEDAIELLPAIPKEWKSGQFKGLTARGGFVIDVSWKDGRILEAKVSAKTDGECRIRHQRHMVSFTAQKGQTYRLREGEQNDELRLF